ncbi:unnamed protein product [Malus baccata var. baccata]
MAMNILRENIILRDEYDLVKFIKLVQQAGLFVNLQIGPYKDDYNFVAPKIIHGFVYAITHFYTGEVKHHTKLSYYTRNFSMFRVH